LFTHFSLLWVIWNKGLKLGKRKLRPHLQLRLWWNHHALKGEL
jgi:hypothetical protein